MQVNEIDAPELKRRLESGDAPILLDIRSQAELAQGMIPGAGHLEMHLLPLRVDDFERDRDIVLYCRSGARSYHACRFLAGQGLDNTVNLRGGIIAWAGSGLPVTTAG